MGYIPHRTPDIGPQITRHLIYIAHLSRMLTRPRSLLQKTELLLLLLESLRSLSAVGYRADVEGQDLGHDVEVLLVPRTRALKVTGYAGLKEQVLDLSGGSGWVELRWPLLRRQGQLLLLLLRPERVEEEVVLRLKALLPERLRLTVDGVAGYGLLRLLEVVVVVVIVEAEVADGAEGLLTVEPGQRRGCRRLLELDRWE